MGGETEGRSTLRGQAEDFADDLTRVVNAVVTPGCDPFKARALASDRRELFSVRQDPDTGIPLCVDGVPLLTLKVVYHCAWDTDNSYLAVDQSNIKVYAGRTAKGEPLFRYDYLRQPTSPDVPSSHLQVHAHRDATTSVMSRVGNTSPRARRRGEAGNDDVHRLSELHFPLGGSRFRPCLEDVLEMLLGEMGVDHQAGAIEALHASRVRWRRLQVRTAVRDAPEVAATMLRELGYVVDSPVPSPTERHDRLSSL